MGSTQRTQSVNSNALPLTIVHPNHQLQLTISRCNSLQGSFSAPALWRLLLLWLSAKASVPTPMPPAACNHSVPVLHPAATPASKPTRRTAPSPSPHQPPRATRRPSATRTALPSKMATWAITSCRPTTPPLADSTATTPAAATPLTSTLSATRSLTRPRLARTRCRLPISSAPSGGAPSAPPPRRTRASTVSSPTLSLPALTASTSSRISEFGKVVFRDDFFEVIDVFAQGGRPASLVNFY